MRKPKLPAALKKAPGAVLKALTAVLKQAKPDEIQISKDGSVIIRYKKEF